MIRFLIVFLIWAFIGPDASAYDYSFCELRQGSGERIKNFYNQLCPDESSKGNFRKHHQNEIHNFSIKIF